MTTESATRKNLSADDWAEAALDAIAAGGIDAVAVEPLARKLGVTKGSFYWHFKNRVALLDAALRLWERQETDEIIARADAESTPRRRITRLFRDANSSVRSGRLYLALAAASEQPLVAEVIQNVSERRMTYMIECYEGLGLNEEDARRWAVFAYSTFLGTLQVRRDAPNALPQGRAFSDYIRMLIDKLIPSGEALDAAFDEPVELRRVV